ncbi:LOW QUALITY PROTEIN: uncharacterized protein EMH_0048390 [Eimeria mitis]|uniref:Uncharacterized protein n=1 Tax=Eimeria mitis TaxID=44415 RepID=U6JUY2_9EIME|nr:LOW QUALITY PROTEIN: uncharacterized protein EMH_0048390 [Eimeria mitis]CDJ29285.1 hypothetical protein EMH_0048390 [Eimeria mitis]
MDGQVAALVSVNTLDEHDESGSAPEMLRTHAAVCSDGELEKGCSTAWGGGPDALTMKEACGTSTAADSPPDTSPVVHAHAEIPATGAGEGACEGEHVHADSIACNDHSDGSQQQQTPPSAIAAPVSADKEEEVAADAVPAAAATVAADEPDKSEKPLPMQCPQLQRRWRLMSRTNQRSQ